MKRVCLLLADAFEAVEASVYTDVIGWNQTEGDGTTELVTVGTRDKLKCTWNFTVIPEMLIEDLNVDDFDALAIPGGFESMGFFEDAYSEPFLDVIREFHRQGKIISTICVAALTLAKSGVLVGKKGTTYNLGNKRQQQLADMGVNLIPDQRIVADGNLITSYNPSTAFDVAFDLLERLTSKDNADEIKRLMGFDQ
jgi:4-methyl-5(b-hydroxyethyl)-thiazole monophosphate biosynthesis